jgi:hypothetical protein
VFGRTVVGFDNWVCNQSLIEYADYRGSFRNVTIQGGVTGFALDLGVIDDYTKDRAEANSPGVRQKVWDWFVDVFQTRMSKTSGLLVVCTRWHIDDLLGRYLERHANDMSVKVLRYPAVAEEDTKFRYKGQALFPMFKPIDLLLERKHEMSIGSWEAEYQQHPIVVGGGQLPIEKLKTVQHFERSQIMSSVRYVDKAGTVSDDAAYSAFVLMHVMRDKTYLIAHERIRASVLYPLDPAFGAVVDSEVDGDGSLPSRMEANPSRRISQLRAATRSARAVFLCTAPLIGQPNAGLTSVLH